MRLPPPTSPFFFFNDTATTEIYTLSLHDALPISAIHLRASRQPPVPRQRLILDPLPELRTEERFLQDRKSTRLNSSHVRISYAVFCLKKKKTHVLKRRPDHAGLQSANE